MALVHQKIPVGRMFVESWKTFFKDWKAFFRISLLWFMIFAGLDSLQQLDQLQSLLNFSEGADGGWIQGLLGLGGGLVMGLIIVPMLMVLFIPIVVSKKSFPKGWFYFALGRTEWTYIGYLVILAVSIIFLVAIGAVPFVLYLFFTPESLVLQGFLLGGGVLLEIGVLYTLLRLSLMGAMVACKDSEGFVKTLKASWHVLKGSTIRLFVLGVLGATCAYIPLFVFGVCAGFLMATSELFWGAFTLLFFGSVITWILLYGYYACLYGKIYAMKRSEALAVFKEMRSRK